MAKLEELEMYSRQMGRVWTKNLPKWYKNSRREGKNEKNTKNESNETCSKAKKNWKILLR
ncbi:MAG TPA: hypothetical protein H9811_10050 [Candidatus Gemmiger excrementigallinarum]|uniref:Uncharacterized protein n=1 Tax=Candidatus Gemmiger excrementigallinarum TaxID=2838609 RepID=A0A9D2ESU6_9FIRM|nr:hypothetical protein [Candidatus Gemmiger excrementigallinarum]